MPAEEVGASAAKELLGNLSSGACVDQHLQDQVSRKQLYSETRPPVTWTGKNCCGRVEIWVDGGGGWVKNEVSKKFSKTIDIVNYASKVSVNGVTYTCVFVVHFRSSDTFKVCKLP